jgi:outer membrane protein assembly factor BamE (lipoprotein component of BamABCDE complex)
MRYRLAFFAPLFPPSLIYCLAIAICFFTSGCAISTQTSGRPINDDQIHKIVKGQSTVEEVIELFGAPQMQSEMGGDILYVYRYTETKGSAFSIGYFTSSGGHDTSDELTITFDKASGKVKACGVQRGIKG